MHVHLPKPLHGWRAFAGEVGIIVVGILIALGAEQVVETIHWHSELTQFRRALDKEVALDLAFYDYRISQGECLSRRVSELDRWRNLQRAGHDTPLMREIGRPSILTFNSSVWRSRSTDLTEHMPIEAELAYADMYDNFDGLNAQLVEERDAWRSLAAFNAANHLSADNLMRLSELIYRVKSLDRAIDAGNGPVLRADAAKLGIKPDWGDYSKYVPAPDPEFCKPLMPSTETG
jgi:hypothetical protein